MTAKIDSFPGREIVIKGKKFLYFGGTAYFGTQTDREFQNIFVTNITGLAMVLPENPMFSYLFIEKQKNIFLNGWVVKTV